MSVGTDITFVAAARPPHPIYLDATPLIDVLLEQLEYLMTHADRCRPDCPDCRRLAQVKRCLLKPFGATA